MYHARFKKTHEKAGYLWGDRLYRHQKMIYQEQTFKITRERTQFVEECLPIYEKYYPEILEEIQGIAHGQRWDVMAFYTFLLSMYCFEFQPHCTCMAVSDGKHIFLARNSDFLVSLEKLYMNVLYDLEGSYAFNGNTTAFVEVEDGINEYGFAVGLTFVYPKIVKPGLNAGMLVRYLLEKSQTTLEAIDLLKQCPIASCQILTMADRFGNIAVVECNSEQVNVILPHKETYLVATNQFVSSSMSSYRQEGIDDWRAKERYQVAYRALKMHEDDLSYHLLKDILSGTYGFMCQYDRQKDADTVWSVIYDIKSCRIFRAEGNPQRKQFKEDKRMSFY